MGIVDEADHLIEHPLGGDFRESLLAVLDTGFKEDECEVLNPRAFVHDPLLDSADEVDAVDLIGVDEVAEVEIGGPIGFIEGFGGGVFDELVDLVWSSLEKLLDLEAHGGHSGGHLTANLRAADLQSLAESVHFLHQIVVSHRFVQSHLE